MANVNINILLDGKPVTWSAGLHADYTDTAGTKTTATVAAYKTMTIPDWPAGKTKVYYDGLGADAPSGVKFVGFSPSDTLTTDGVTDVTLNVNFTVDNTSLYLGIGVAALAGYFLFFRKKSLIPAVA